MTKAIKKAVVRGSLPYEGFRGVIFYTDGTQEVVRQKVMVEACDIGENFQWDFYPFDTKEAAAKATRARVNQIKRAAA